MPNFSVGEEPGTIGAIADAAAEHAKVLDHHSDSVHARSVLTLAAAPEGLAAALVAAATEAIARIDLRVHSGAHPRIGAVDVCPIVYPDPALAGLARGLARELASSLAALDLPVFLYGELAATAERRERHYFRRGGIEALARRMRSGELDPDLGPAEPHPTAGATLLTARGPLAAFNLEVEGADLAACVEVAAALRESGGGLPGVRAIAIELGAGRVQVSTNVHDPLVVPLARIVAEAERLLPEGGRVVAAELIGLVPAASLSDFPDHVAIRDLDPARMTIEQRLAEGE